MADPVKTEPRRFTPKPPISLREQVSKGLKFEHEPGACAACGPLDEVDPILGYHVVDKRTGLGPKCWRVWRWSSVRERNDNEVAR